MNVRQCYELIDCVLESRSWDAACALLAWFDLMANDIERSKVLFREAEERCKDDQELAYVLHLQSLALSREGQFDIVLKTRLRCLDICRATRNKHLLVRVLLNLALIYNTTGADDLARVYTEEAMAV